MDGRGSSPRSQHGVAAARAAARDALRGMEAQLALALDGPGDWVARVAWRGAALMIYAAAAWAQERAAADLGCEPREMEFTLALCAAGRRPVFSENRGGGGFENWNESGRDGIF